MQYNLLQLLKNQVDQGASDLHITCDSPPRLRIDGSLVPLRVEPLTSKDVKELCYGILNDHQKRKLEQEKEIDLAIVVKDVARFRVNVFHQRNEISGAFRVIPSTVRSLEDLGLPLTVRDFCNAGKGLVLVTGPTGSGKSTSLAAMIDHINMTRYDHIITIEDPIEFIHTHKQCIVNQRELGNDTSSFASALRSALRQDPDVIMVGELRDLETISAALTAAETGHLVFGTLHTNSCVATLNRIIDAFPPHQQVQVRTQLSMTLVSVMSQMLVPLEAGGRVMALELLKVNGAISALINEGKFNQIYSNMQSGQQDTGMRTMNQSLMLMLNRRMISVSTAMRAASDPAELEKMIANAKNKSGFVQGHLVKKKVS